MTTADQKDIDNIEAWAEVVQGIMRHVPFNRRAEVLALVLKKEEADRKNLGDRLKTLSFNELFDMSPGLRHWNAIMRLKSLVVQVFVRNITNNHSPADATALLFGHQHFGTGSGELFDYLGDLTKRVERLQSKGARQTS